MTPSEWVASTVVELLGADPARVRAVSSTWDTGDDVDASAVRFARRRTGRALSGGHPPAQAPRPAPARRCELVRGRTGDVTLVLTGGAGRAETDVVAAIARSAVSVVRPGRVSAAALRGLYRRADVLAFPSAYEGFGLPVLEAMRSGLPVVAPHEGALPEVRG